MKKLIYRVLAYAFDMVIISIITLGLTNIKFINPLLEEYQKQYTEVTALNSEYNDLTNKLNEIFEDKKIEESELEKIKDYSIDLTESVNKELSDEEIQKINDNASETYVDSINTIAYAMTKNNTITKIITIVVTIIYLGILQFVFKGRTLGKFIFGLKVVSNKDDKEKVPFWSYLVRSILVGEILILLSDLVLLYSSNQGIYIKGTNILNTIQYIYEIVFLVVMMMREDTRSVHDILLKTRVALYDRKGNEIIEVAEEPPVEVKEEKKTTKTPSTKKKTSTKKTKKEFVSAEKIDD